MTMNLLQLSSLAYCGLVSCTLCAQSINLAPILLTVDIFATKCCGMPGALNVARLMQLSTGAARYA